MFIKLTKMMIPPATPKEVYINIDKIQTLLERRFEAEEHNFTVIKLTHGLEEAVAESIPEILELIKNRS